MYSIIVNEPGYLPDDMPAFADSFADAFSILWEEIGRTLANDPEYTIGDKSRFRDACKTELERFGSACIPIDGYNHEIRKEI